MQLFSKREGCPKCKALIPHIPDGLEVHYLDDVDGMAHASFYDIMSVPQLILGNGDRVMDVDKIIKEMT